MKAIVYREYGSPDVLRLEDVEKPDPKADEVLVHVQAASLNYGDVALVRGKPLVARLWSGLRAPKYKILGTDICGRIEEVGRNVKGFRPGDEVFGDVSACGFGAFAEYVSVPEHALAPKPANLTCEEAAALPQAAVVALQGLRNKGRIRTGQRALINGASGGVGTFAVQIAKALGAEVTGVCSSRHLHLVRAIGADHAIDYTQQDFTEGGNHYDLIFDIVANRPLSAYLRVLDPQGIYVACAFNPSTLFLGPLISRKKGRKAVSLYQKPNQEDLVYIKDLVEAGKVTPVIDRCFPLNDVAEAVRYLQTGGRHGKVVINHTPRSA